MIHSQNCSTSTNKRRRRSISDDQGTTVSDMATVTSGPITTRLDNGENMNSLHLWTLWTYFGIDIYRILATSHSAYVRGSRFILELSHFYCSFIGYLMTSGGMHTLPA